ncbi:MaoC family dehydratase [Jannaschia seohaensis]|uniref:MaoC dehydratase-like protein n=1 Tax=Jannaschia seohaensis TaxID=475081 RepID=A0A2Y9ADE9_9RHOB|nr:MaoC/PaaZ C-terminal domain-containing protein [Jannaschia seohaensis]PWJ20878.1 MaoC dehydratase-like protein [Jannaschia seohaensis]SSA41288.1 MaoC like domain-containing protein [Jannaschia seohaensis]
MKLAPGDDAWDDLPVGAWWRSGRRIVTAADIDAFADFSGDRFAIHMDDAAAGAMGVRGGVAHGLLVLSLVDGLKNAAPVQMRAVVSLGWEWSFPQRADEGLAAGHDLVPVGLVRLR